MALFDALSLISSIAALILAIGAIWLSIVFFRMSSDASKATNEAAKGIESSVERLENLFDKLYSDTFSIMRDTVSDMRKHMWPSDESEQEKVMEEAEKKADEKIVELKKTMEEQLASMLRNQKITDEKMLQIRKEMRHLLERAIVSSRQLETEAREETIREHILRTHRMLQRRRPKVTVEMLVSALHFPPVLVLRELEKIREEGLIRIIPDEDILPESIVKLEPRGTGGTPG